VVSCALTVCKPARNIMSDSNNTYFFMQRFYLSGAKDFYFGEK
jgi:hypothetical protein